MENQIPHSLRRDIDKMNEKFFENLKDTREAQLERELKIVKQQLALNEFYVNHPEVKADDKIMEGVKAVLKDAGYRHSFGDRFDIIDDTRIYELAYKAFKNQPAPEEMPPNEKMEIARNKLIEKYPELSKKETSDPILKGMTELLKTYGYTKQEVEAVTDHRFLSIVYEAFKAGVK